MSDGVLLTNRFFIIHYDGAVKIEIVIYSIKF